MAATLHRSADGTTIEGQLARHPLVLVLSCCWLGAVSLIAAGVLAATLSDLALAGYNGPADLLGVVIPIAVLAFTLTAFTMLRPDTKHGGRLLLEILTTTLEARPAADCSQQGPTVT